MALQVFHRRRIRILAFIIVVLGIVLLAIGVAERVLPAKISGPCGPECALSVERISFRPNGIWLKSLRFVTCSEKLEKWEIYAPWVKVHPSWASVVNKEAGLRFVTIFAPEVTLTQGEDKPKDPVPPPPFFVDGLAIDNAQFHFVQNHHGRKGNLSLDQITVRSTSFGTISGRENESSHMEATARLEGSGKVMLRIDARVFKSDPDLTLQLDLKDQKLSGVNGYFGEVDKVLLGGTVNRASGRVISDGQKIHAETLARYSGLDVKLLDSKDRSGLATFLMNIFSGMKLKSGNMKDAPKDIKGMANISRLPKEPIVAFVLRGLKEALLQVASRHI